MALPERPLSYSISRMPFIDSADLAGVLGEPHATIHRALTGLLAGGIVGRVSHGTAHLLCSQRYYLTANGIRETAGLLGFATPSDFVRAYPLSREWLTLLIRRMDAVAAVYRLAASLSPGIDGLRSHRAVARINGARQCLACGQESDEDGPGAADAVDVVRTENHARMETMRWAAKLLHLRYKRLLRWARSGEVPATDWDPRQSRRGRRVRLADSEERVEKKKTVACAEGTGMTVLQEFPKGKQRRFCPPPAKCKTRWHSRHRQR